MPIDRADIEQVHDLLSRVLTAMEHENEYDLAPDEVYATLYEAHRLTSTLLN